MQNKSKTNTVLLVIIIILLVAGLVYFFFNDSKQKVLDQKNEINNPNINTQEKISSNKLFDLFDATSQDGPVVSSIKFINPEQHLVILHYWISQETGAYAVYDYKNDVLYKNIGSSGIDGSNEPKAFIGMDKLLMYSNFAETKSSLTVQDFHNKVIKTIMTDKPLHEVYPLYGKKITIDTDMKDSGRFNLNTENLELSPWIR